jgi:hypothetical protein
MSPLDYQHHIRVIRGDVEGVYLIGNHVVNLPIEGKNADYITDEDVAKCGIPGVRVEFHPVGVTLRKRFDSLQEYIQRQINYRARCESEDLKELARVEKMRLAKLTTKLSREVARVARG